MALKAPFPYFGGKSGIAGEVWRRFGTVKNYVEPFFGSGAMLLARPDWRPGVRLVETVNDADGLLSNFWRALKADPNGVAEAADWPVNECDLLARHLWLMGERERITERLMGDPEWYDVRAAGWWVWGASCWIGSGWAGRVARKQLPHIDPTGLRGVVAIAGVSVLDPVAQRIQLVRVACGDWARVCSASALRLDRIDSTAIFLDPPYDEGVGYTAGGGVAGEVWAWACANGDNPLLRLAVCGYEDGREVPPGWRVLPWATGGGYGNRSADGNGRTNARRERVWFSPHCIPCEGDLDCATGELVQVGGQLGLAL